LRLLISERLKSVNWDLEVALHKADSEAADLRDSEARQMGEVKRLNAVIDRQTEQIDSQLATESKLREQLADQEASHASMLAELRSDKDAAKREVQDLQDRLDAVTAELEEQKKLARLRDRSRSPVKQMLETVDSDEEPTTPDRSPRMSPIKGTPSRHVTLEAETLKGSLLNSHRMLQHSKQQALKEKAEKIDLRRQLKEALDELEELKQLQGSMMPRRRFMRGAAESDRSSRPRSGRGLESRRQAGTISEEEAGWEEADLSGSDHTISPDEPDESVYSAQHSRAAFSREGYVFESELEDSSSSPHRDSDIGRRILGTHALMSGSQVNESARPLFAELEGRSMASSSAHSPETVRGAPGSAGTTPTKNSFPERAQMIDAGTMTTAAWRETPKRSPLTTQFIYEDPANQPASPRSFKSNLTFLKEDGHDATKTAKASSAPPLTFVYENPSDFPDTPKTSPSQIRTEVASPQPLRSPGSFALLPPLWADEPGSEASFLPPIELSKPPSASSQNGSRSPVKASPLDADASVLATRVIAPLRRKSASQSTLKSKPSKDTLGSTKQDGTPPLPPLPLPSIEVMYRPTSPAVRDSVLMARGIKPPGMIDDEWHLQNYLAGPAGPQRQIFVYPEAQQPVAEHVGRIDVDTANAAVQANSATADASTSVEAVQQQDAIVQAEPERCNTGTDPAQSTLSLTTTGVQVSKEVRDAFTAMSPKAKRFFGIDVDHPSPTTSPVANQKAGANKDGKDSSVTSSPKNDKHDFSQASQALAHAADGALETQENSNAPDSPTLSFNDNKRAKASSEARSAKEAAQATRSTSSPFKPVPRQSTDSKEIPSETPSVPGKVPVAENRLNELLRKETELAASQQAIAQLTREKLALQEKPLPADPGSESKPSLAAETILDEKVNHLQIKTRHTADDNASDTSCWTPNSVPNSEAEDSESDILLSHSNTLRCGLGKSRSPTAKADRVLGKSPETSPMSTKSVSRSLRGRHSDVGKAMAPPIGPSTARDTLRSRQQGHSIDGPRSRQGPSSALSDFGSDKRPSHVGSAGRGPVRSHSHQSVSSLSSFASDCDTRFNAASTLEPGQNIQEDALDLATMNAVKRTMIGMSLYKYMRRPGWQGLSDKRHQRFFWLNPYTQTLYWSAFNPVNAPENAVIKSTPVVGLYTEPDFNPLPPGIQQRTMCIETPTRLLKVTAISSSDHEDWMRALDHLIHGCRQKEQDREILSDFDGSPVRRKHAVSGFQAKSRDQQCDSAAETPSVKSGTIEPVESQRTMRPASAGRSQSMTQLSSAGMAPRQMSTSVSSRQLTSSMSMSSRVSSLFKSPTRTGSSTGRMTGFSSPFRKQHFIPRGRSSQDQQSSTVPPPSTMTWASRDSSTTSLSRTSHQWQGETRKTEAINRGVGGSGITMDDLADAGLENVRSCCGGRHDVGTLCRRPSSALSNHR
jgi:hypothetical protein